jgi:hypothetical protein
MAPGPQRGAMPRMPGLLAWYMDAHCRSGQSYLMITRADGARGSVVPCTSGPLGPVPRSEPGGKGLPIRDIDDTVGHKSTHDAESHSGTVNASVIPPSSGMAAPVIKPESSPARNAIVPAASSSVPKRPIGQWTRGF